MPPAIRNKFVHGITPFSYFLRSRELSFLLCISLEWLGCRWFFQMHSSSIAFTVDKKRFSDTSKRQNLREMLGMKKRRTREE